MTSTVGFFFGVKPSWGIVLLSAFFLLLLAGCPGQQPNSANDLEDETRLVVSPVTIIEERESVITGQGAGVGSGNGSFFNKTVPDYKFEPNKTLFIFFINVSFIKDWSPEAGNERQGEAILIKKGDADILIDAGPAENANYLINFLRQKGVDDIELLISTHARPENYGALGTLLDNIEVEQFMWNGDTGGDAAYAALVEKAKQKSRKSLEAEYLSEISINGINLLVLNPRNWSERFSDIDNNGIVLKITDRDFCLMTTGDIAYGAQAKISTGNGFDPKCEVLQIPNYGLGLGTSQIDLLLLKVAPKTAIITGSPFDPADERYTIEEKLRVKRIRYYGNFNSSRNSTNIVRITSDGYNYSVMLQ